MAGAADRLARELADLKRRVSSVERSSQMRYRSVEGGALEVNDDEGTPVLAVGLQDDGSYAVVGMNGGKVVADEALPGIIGTTEIADDSVSTPKIQANAITANEIAAGSITANEIAAGSITANEIAAGSITAVELAADSVTATQIQAGAIDGTTIDAVTITGASITGAVLQTASSGNRIKIEDDGTGTGRVDFFSGQALESTSGALVSSVNTYADGTPYSTLSVVSPEVDGNSHSVLYMSSESVTLGGGGVYGSSAEFWSDFLRWVEEDSLIEWEWAPEGLQTYTYPQTTPYPDMVLQPFGGEVVVTGPLAIAETQDASPASGNAPGLRIGDKSGKHLRIDGNEILPMTDDATVGTLYLANAPGADVRIGPNGRHLGGMDFGVFEASDSAGNFTVSHSLGTAPTVVIATLLTDLGGGVEKWHVVAGERNSSSFGLHVNDNTGSNVTSTVRVSWLAMI